jgi:hypothetical protein
MKKKTPKKPVPVMKQLARSMSKKEIEAVGGACTGAKDSGGDETPIGHQEQFV